MLEFYEQYDSVQYIVLMLAAVLIGINKTGMPGIGTLPVVMLTMVFPTVLSTGIQLLLLATADIMAVCYYKISGNLKLVFKLLPCACVGLAIGSYSLNHIENEDMLRRVIGGIIIFIALVGIIKDIYFPKSRPPANIFLAALIGMTAGFTTQVANAAGPIMALYLLAMRLPKEEYMGTSVLFFVMLNWIKMPIFILEDRITLNALYIMLPMIPMLVVGAWLGVVFVKKAPQRVFNLIVQSLVLISAIKLCFF